MPPRNLHAVFANINQADWPMLKRIAKDEGVSVSRFVRGAINDALEAQGLSLTALKTDGLGRPASKNP